MRHYLLPHCCEARSKKEALLIGRAAASFGIA